MNLPLVNILRWTSILARTDPRLGSLSTSCVMNHSGNCQAVIPVCGAVGSSLSGGGLNSFNDGSGGSKRSFSLSTRRGSMISSPSCRPRIQPAYEDGVIGQVHHRAGAKRGNQLASTYLSVWSATGATTHDSASSSASISTPSIVLSHRLTLGSTSRIERLARNFLCLGGSVLSSGLRNSYSNL